MVALRAQRLTKRYGQRCAVDAVDMALEPGEVRGLLGPNGAGKTTLLRMLLGLVRPDYGQVEMFGCAPNLGKDALPAAVAGFVEEPAFYPYLSARANLEVLAELDLPGPAASAEEVLEQVGLAADAGERVAGYSTGMRQRLGLAAALLRSPRLLLLDEPTAGLDPAGMRLVQRLVSSLAEQGVAILLSSHHIAEVERVCDTFTVLRNGRTVWEGTATAMRDEAPPPVYRLATSDDARAAAVAQQVAGIVCSGLDTGGLEVSAREIALDSLVLALASRGLAVRRLEQSGSPLEAMFFELTDEPDSSPPSNQRETLGRASRV